MPYLVGTALRLADACSVVQAMQESFREEVRHAMEITGWLAIYRSI